MGQDQRRDPAPKSDTRNPKRRKLSDNQPRRPSLASSTTRDRNGPANTRKKCQKQPRPPRERRTVAITSKSSPSLADADGTSPTLYFAKVLLDRIWVRNKNQHRTQPWWRSLSLLRKAIANFITLEDEERMLQSQAKGSGSVINAQEVRKRFERETQLRREKDVWIDWLREVLVPKAYLDFSVPVGDTQFANLGVVLIGVLADVMKVVGAPKKQLDVADDGPQSTVITNTNQGGNGNKSQRLTATSLRVTGIQSGELVERQYDSDDVGEVVERKRNNTVGGRDEEQRESDEPSSHRQIATPADPSSQQLEPESTCETLTSIDADAGLPPRKSQPTTDTAPASTKEPEAKKAKPKDKTKKGRGKKNAIDDLFAGLT